MSKLHRHICDCAASHAENGDVRGAEAIMFAANNSKAAALKQFPDCKPALDNAYAFARQETATA